MSRVPSGIVTRTIRGLLLKWLDMQIELLLLPLTWLLYIREFFALSFAIANALTFYQGHFFFYANLGIFRKNQQRGLTIICIYSKQVQLVFFSNKMICVIRVRIHKGILMRSTPKNGSNYIDEAFIWNWDYFDGQELFLSFFKGQECMEWLRIFKLDFF